MEAKSSSQVRFSTQSLAHAFMLSRYTILAKIVHGSKGRNFFTQL